MDIREKTVTLENFTLYKKKTTLSENLALLSKKIQALKKNAVLDEDNHQTIHWITFASQICFGETANRNGISLACSSIVTYISEIKILWVLNRRIKQIDNRDFIKFHRSNYEHANIICFNDTSLTWVVALSEVPFNISEICSNRLVSNSKITQLGPLLEYSSITSLEEVFESLNFSVRKIIGIILKLYQVYQISEVVSDIM